MSAKTDNKLLWKFIYKTFLLALLPTVLFLSAYEVAYRHVPNSYSLKKEYLDARADSVEVLVLGSSHSFYGINPDYFTLKTFNAANVSQSFDYDAMIYDRYFKGKPSPRYLILSVSFFSLWERLGMTDEYWRSRKYSIYMGLGVKPEWFSPDGYEFQLGDRTVAGYYLLGKDFTGCTPSGFGCSYVCGHGVDLKEGGVSAAARHSVMDRGSESVFMKNISVLEDILSDCSACGRRVVFLVTPFYKTYIDALPSVQIERTYQVLDSLHRAYPDNTAILDFSSDRRFDAADFYDADHLCTDGAAKLSVILNDTLPKAFNSVH